MEDQIFLLITIVFLTATSIVSIYGVHRLWLVFLYRQSRQRPTPDRFDQLPTVTIQLPMFNESRVAQRIIDAVCHLDYPRDRIQVQVLDDSTDETQQIARARVDHWRQLGTDIEYIHRTNRDGYKAGALANGMRTATGEFILIFDADFIPPPDFIHNIIHHFTDESVGMVQARWEHINRNDSLFTRSQAVFLDGHFIIEHTARNRRGRWINFNGTAGAWRRSAIDDAGGWQGDTLTEDVDLSYRAQLAGWQFVYLPNVTCPAELPQRLNAFKSQQHRWVKGTIQCAHKLLPSILRTTSSTGAKIEAFIHLTTPVIYPCIILMAILLPALLVKTSALTIGVGVIALGAVCAAAFYMASQRARGCSVIASIAYVPVLLCIGIYVSLNNTRGFIEALLGKSSPFVRTPKHGGQTIIESGA